MNVSVIKKSIGELVLLIERKEDAALAFNAACDAVAHNADCEASDVKKAVTAHYKDKLNEAKIKAENTLSVIDAIATA